MASDNEVAGIYDRYKGKQGKRIRELRDTVLDVAKNTPGVGRIEECLKWGQPSFVTVNPKSGSTIRIDAVKDSGTKVAVYFICNTNLVDRFRERYPETFTFEGNRALVFDVDKDLPEAELRHCIAMALTYHL